MLSLIRLLAAFTALACICQAHIDHHRRPVPDGLAVVGDSGHHRDLLAGHGPRCGAKDLSPAERKTVQQKFRLWKRGQSKNDRKLSGAEPITIKTYFHVIAETEGGRGSEAVHFVHDQLQVLNDRFLPYGFQFSLAAEPQVTVNRAWYHGRKEEEMKAALKQGGADTLNVYTNSGGGSLGYAYFPTIVGTEFEVLDGVVMYYQSMPGGTCEPPECSYVFNQGMTLVHEVGHYLMLLHTFDGESCDCLGDMVDDTPAQSEYSRGCPVGKDTCVDDAGVDHIHNYMDYSEDSCLEEFTRGQAERMRFAWETFRAPNAVVNDIYGVFEGPEPSPCGESSGQDFTLELTTDLHGDETFWTVVDVETKQQVLEGGPYASKESYTLGPYCLGAGAYVFNIYDLYGDGICCQLGKGSYEAFVDGTIVARGGRFTCGESTPFTVVA